MRGNPQLKPTDASLDTAQAGWELLAADEAVLRCYNNSWDARYYSDSGAGLALLNAGYNLDSLMLRYQGVDWRSKDNWECNAR